MLQLFEREIFLKKLVRINSPRTYLMLSHESLYDAKGSLSQDKNKFSKNYSEFQWVFVH